jgi:hypothetical protein
MANGTNFSRIKCWGKIGVALIRPSGIGSMPLGSMPPSPKGRRR